MEKKVSKRVQRGKIEVVKGKCNDCNHDKLWNKPNGKSCCKCGSNNVVKKNEN